MGRKKKRKLIDFKIKKKTVFSIISLLFFAGAALSVFSFLQEGLIPTKLNIFLLEWLGAASLLFPFLLICYAFFFSRFKTSLRQPHVSLGATVFWVSFLGLARGGLAGGWIWERLQFLVTPMGSFLILFIGIIIGILVLFNTSLDRLVEFIFLIFNAIKRYLISPDSKKKPPVFLEDKGTDVGQAAEAVDQISPPPSSPSLLPPVETSASSEMPEGSPPVLRSDSATEDKSFLESDGLLLQMEAYKIWRQPPLSLLSDINNNPAERGNIKERAQAIERTLDSFGILAKVKEINSGPSVTQYCLEVALGTKLSKITTLSSNLALALAAPTGQIRIEAPIPGRSLVGIEVPNYSLEMVSLKKMFSSSTLMKSKSKLAVPLGLDVSGKPIIADIGKMPHVLVAGRTGSGKSVLINSWITTLLFRASPNELRLILVDPKRVEMNRWNGVPHLLTPVINDSAKVVSALKWAVDQMQKRYKLFAQAGSRGIDSYNKLAGIQNLPYILIIIDELADIMSFAPAEAEDCINRLAQMARATGIHLVLATQRPSVDVITGLIKNNIPYRISCAVPSLVDSRVILDNPGAEKLLGRGDMLYVDPNKAKPARIQGTFVSEKEMAGLVEFIKNQGETNYDGNILSQPVGLSGKGSTVLVGDQEQDLLFDQAVEFAIKEGKASISRIQRRFKIGFSRAGGIVDEMERKGIVGPPNGSRPREILISSWPLKKSD